MDNWEMIKLVTHGILTIMMFGIAFLAMPAPPHVWMLLGFIFGAAFLRDIKNGKSKSIGINEPSNPNKSGSL
jgi:hypothetical protein